MRATIAVVLAAPMLAACLVPPPPDPRMAERLARWLTGTFSSAEQHAESHGEYESIRLVMLPIWPDRDDGPWLYVEEATAAALSRPYRQRVYHLVPQRGGTVRSDVFLLPGEPLAWSGAWRNTTPLSDLRPELLTPRHGCSIELRPVADDRWVGATSGRGCASQREGASYATSEVVLGPDRLDSWNRGFDDDGRQVWGAENGPYRFARLSNTAPD